MVYTAQWNIVNDLLFPKDIWRSSDLLLRTSLEANVTTRQRFPTTFMPLKMTSISRKMFPSLSHSLFALTQVFPFSFILTSCLPFLTSGHFSTSLIHRWSFPSWCLLSSFQLLTGMWEDKKKGNWWLQRRNTVQSIQWSPYIKRCLLG